MDTKDTYPRKHIMHLVTAYAHGQLSAQQRRRVQRHVARCAICRAELDHAELLASDLQRLMPGFGQAAPGQLERLLPDVLQNSRRILPNVHPAAHSYGMALALALAFVIVSSALFQSPSYASAAPFQQPVPGEIRATATPIFTEEPWSEPRVTRAISTQETAVPATATAGVAAAPLNGTSDR